MRKIRVLVVDDSATIRRIVADAIAASPDLELAGTAANGRLALDRLQAARADVVTLDVEMPVLDGIATLKALRAQAPRLPVLMFSSLTEKGALATLDALAAGASDFVTKSRAASLEAARAFVELEVLPRLRALGSRATGSQAPAVRLAPAPPPSRLASRVEAVVIGVSTGGPQALEQVLPRLPRDLAVPVLVVQHMPAMFTELLARRLGTLSAVAVAEAADGMPVLPGKVYIAKGGRHLTVEGRATLRLDDGPPENSCKPAADVLFRSAAENWKAGVLAVVLTGMGRDGCSGSEKIRAAGGSVVIQDQETSVVWGMPGAVAGAGLADATLPIAGVAAEIVARVERGRLPGLRCAL